MKKQYIRYGTVFCILAIVLFLVAFVLFTKNRIDEYNRNFSLWYVTPIIDYHDVNDDGWLEQKVIASWESYLENEFFDHTGFYSSMKDVKTGEVILDSGRYPGFDGDDARNKLNDEARRLSDDAEQAYKGPSYSDVKKGIFTSSSVVIDPAGDGDFHVSYCIVGRPFNSVLKANAGTYIVMLIVWIVAESAVVVSFVILYRNQMNYEIRNQKLTRGIAHELKTPLAVTKATVENWDYFDEDRRKDYSQRVKSEVDHMSDMVGKLLEVSKIKDGSSKPVCKDVDLSFLTGDIIEGSKELIRERGITVTFNRDDKPYMIFADPDMMNIVISNFVSNAVKYCDHVIMIRLIRNGRKIEFSITNDGAKIEKEELDKVWDIFYTTDKSRTDRMSNSGVGLSVVKSILDAHKAEYGCTSGDNGTEFKFSLPAREQS